MSYKTIEKKIKMCKKDLRKLENQVLEKKSYLQGLEEAMKFFPKDSKGGIAPQTVLRHGSDMAKSRDFLQALGKPAHVSEIVIGIGKENTKKNRISLSGSLSNYSRREDIFIKTAPNTFTLVEMKSNEASDAPKEEPPSGFGLQSHDSDDLLQ